MLLAWDVPGESGVARRGELRAAHVEGVTERFHDGSVILGAGIYDDAGVVRGSVVILDCESRADVDSYLATEPFQVDGLWARVDIHELKLPDMYLEHRRSSPS